MRKYLSKITAAISRPRPTVHSVASTDQDLLRKFSVSKDDLFLAFQSSWIMNRAIRFRADLIVARGFHLEYPDEKSKEIITRFLKNVKLNSPHHFDLNSLLRFCCIDTDWSGNGFLQLVPNAKKTKIVKLHPLHPLYTDYQRESDETILMDDSGEPFGFSYVPKGDSLTEISLGRDEVAHLLFEKVGDMLLGTSLILSVFRSIERLTNIDWAIAQALYKHGLPTRSISVGDSNHEPTTEDIEKVAEDVKGIDSAAEYTHPYWQQVGTVDPKWPSNVEAIPKYFVQHVVTASGIPHHILLGEERVGTKATAQSLQRALSLMLDPLQLRLKSFVEDQIFRHVLDLEDCDSEVSFIWHEPVPEPALPLADKVIDLANTFIEGRALITWAEARNMLKLTTSVEAIELNVSAENYWGLPLVAPHAQLIWQGRKKAIVKSKEFRAHIGEPLYLLQNQVCYGIVRLDSPVEISLKEFNELAPKHLVSEEERKEWWLEYDKLYYYPVIIDKRFDPPRDAEYDSHAQVFVSEVKLK